MKYSIVTFGCRVNQADSLQIEEDLRRRGGQPCSPDGADLVIVNTCSVTATADQGARQTIRRIARENPSARIVTTGCYATRRPEELATLPSVVAVIRNPDKLQLLDQIETPTAERFGDGDGACGATIEPGFAGRTAFTLRVQTGCDQVCSYCIIPTTRGSGRSTPLADVLREVRRIAAAGFKEIALTGVHLGSYGRDLPNPSSLFDLLCALQQMDVDVTFRISSLEPMDCTPEIVDLVASSGGRFAPHFHLPLQHASDRMLQAMRRPYSRQYYTNLLDRIIARVPHAAIGTDMIVGFPGETDENFEENISVLRAAPLSHIHVFPYSDRPGTAAAALGDRVAGPVIRSRAARLREVGVALAKRFQAAQVGTIRSGLTTEDGSLVVTDNYLKLRVAPGLLRNTRVNVEVRGPAAGVVVA